MKVLVAEDDTNIRLAIVEILEDEGYQVVQAPDGEEALARFRSRQPDFVCLDIMMPKVNGYDVCREIRNENEKIPIIFLSAKTEEVDRVLGLELGADDYVMKPFGKKEFVARIRAVSRRCLRGRAEKMPGSFKMGDLKVFPEELRVKRGRKVIELSLIQTKILQLLYERKGKVVDRDLLFQRCWGPDAYPESRTIDQHVYTLRKKIERDVACPKIVQTVRGVGYRYE